MEKYVFRLLALSIAFLCSCSTAKYSSINKIKRNNSIVLNQSPSGQREDVTMVPEHENTIVQSSNLNEENILSASLEKGSGIISKPFTAKKISITSEGQKRSAKELSASQRVAQKIIAKEITKSAVSSSGKNLLWTVIAVLLVLWLFALLFGGGSLGGIVHLLLVVALVLLIYKLLI